MDVPQHLPVWLRTFDEPGAAIPFRLMRDAAVPAATDTPDRGQSAAAPLAAPICDRDRCNQD